MTTILLAIVVVGVLMLAMAVGVLAGRKPISGSCGGMKALGMEVECEICGGNPSLCDSAEDQPQQELNSRVETFDPRHKSD